MTAMTQSTRRKLSLLNLTEELHNVSTACRIMGDHRDTFCEVRRAFQVGGVAALVEQRRGPRGSFSAPESTDHGQSRFVHHPGGRHRNPSFAAR